MRKLISILLALVLTCGVLTTVCFAWTPDAPEEIYVKLNGIKGLSEDRKHCYWIEGIDCKINYKTENGETVPTGITFTHTIEPATTKIMNDYLKGHVIYAGTAQICKTVCGRQYTVLDVAMETIRITDIQVITLADGTVAETVTLTVKTVTVTETPLPEF